MIWISVKAENRLYIIKNLLIYKQSFKHDQHLKFQNICQQNVRTCFWLYHSNCTNNFKSNLCHIYQWNLKKFYHYSLQISNQSVPIPLLDIIAFLCSSLAHSAVSEEVHPPKIFSPFFLFFVELLYFKRIWWYRFSLYTNNS